MRRLVLGMGALLCLPCRGYCAAIQWNGAAGDGQWTTSGNWSPAQVPSSGDDVTIDVTATVFAASQISFGFLTLGDPAATASPTLQISAPISTPGTVTINKNAALRQATSGLLSFGSVNVLPGGVMTHAANTTSLSYSLNISVSGDFTLQAGGMIFAAGLGYISGTGPGAGGNVIDPFSGGGGGGHGGAGGNGGPGGNGAAVGIGGPAYDSLLVPNDLGSGGGTGGYDNADFAHRGRGGSGGGVVALNVGGALTLNGTIDASGNPGQLHFIGLGGGGGGGAGGTINLTAGTLAGSGSVSANGGAGALSGGGNPNATGGGGGGGRIAILVNTSDSSNLTLRAAGGAGNFGGKNGGAGTISLKTPGSAIYSLRIDNQSLGPQSGTPVSGTSLAFSSASLNNGLVSFDPASTVNMDSLFISGTVTLSANNLVFAPNGTIELKSGANLRLSANSTSGGNLLIDSGATFIQTNNAQLGFSSVNMLPGSLMIHNPNTDARSSILNLNITGDFTLQSGATIYVAGLGYGSDQGPGAGSGRIDAFSGGGGGGHGGTGGAGGNGGGSGGMAYDSLLAPNDLGSGGATGGYDNADFSHRGRGGNGGGAVLLSVGGALTVNGTIDASGNPGQLHFSGLGGGGGGGAGGTINLTAGTLAGSGSVSANGGAGALSGGGNPNATGGGGAGGRISLFYGSKTFSWTPAAIGGAGTNKGSDGTIEDNGQPFGTISGSSTTAVSQLQQKLTASQSLSETIAVQPMDFSGAAATGAVTGAFDSAQIQLVSVKTGSFAGKGFFTGNWHFAFPFGGALSGTWGGTAFLSTSPRQIVLKGYIDGGIRGVMEGVLTESSHGSGIFNRLSATLSAIQVGIQVGAGSMYLTGSATAGQATQYAGAALSLMQTSLTGPISGYVAGAIDMTFTLLRVNDPANPFYNQGFFLPTYSHPLGSGAGWAYASGFSQNVRIAGVLEAPLKGRLTGTLSAGPPQSMLFTLERLDPIVATQPAILTVTTTGPGGAGAGALDSYAIAIRNDGFGASESVTVIAELPDWADFSSASQPYTFYNIASWRGTGLFSARPVLRWDLFSIQPRSTIVLNYQVRFKNPANGGPGAHEQLDPGQVQLITRDWADRLFTYYPPGGTP